MMKEVANHFSNWAVCQGRDRTNFHLVNLPLDFSAVFVSWINQIMVWAHHFKHAVWKGVYILA